MISQDFRARLQPKDMNQAQYILGPRDSSNILFPLYSTRGVLFPYTPSVSTGHTAEYNQHPFVHTNYSYNAYVRSLPKPISVTAAFTAQTNNEALYLLSVLHFFKSVTKMYFGVTPYNRAGIPPPVLLFNYLGEHQFNNVPVVIKDVSYVFESNIDYVPVDTSDILNYTPDIGVAMPIKNMSGYSYVPTHMSLTVEMDTQYIPNKIKNEFNLDEFRSGKMVGKGYI